MNLTFLTQVGGILKPFAWVMGEILNYIYKLIAMVGIKNIAICIVVFTIVVKMLMLPLTIKQQKFAKVSAKMNPELQALQAKYKNVDRSDREAMGKMAAEQQELYQKYGASPFGGCLPLLIMLPILFALYRVIYAVPAYVDDVKVLYNDVAQAIITEVNDTEYEDTYSAAIKEFYTAEKVSMRNKKGDDVKFTSTDLIDIFSVFNTSVWDDFETGKQLDGCDKWNALASSEEFKKAMSSQKDNVAVILDINGLFGKYNILDAPGFAFPAILLPILAALLQFIQGKISMGANTQSQNDDSPMASSMKSMNTIMPIMSGIFCVFLPIGVGIYWIVNSGVTILQQLVINKHLDTIGIDEMIAENEEKKKEQYEKYGVHANGAKTNAMANIAKSSTRSIAAMNTEKMGKKSGKSSSASTGNEKGNMISEEKKESLKNQAKEGGKASISQIANLLGKDKED